MRQIINIETWKRKEDYLFFKSFQSPLVGVTVEVDCTVACRKAKEQAVPLSLYYLHAALVAANRIEEFRYREEEGQVVCYDTIDLFTPIITADGNFRSVVLPYRENFEDFRSVATPRIDRAKKGEGQSHGDSEHRQDLLLISVNPWYRFTGIQLSDPAKPHESFPIFTFGKITPENGKQMMPVSLRVNHGFVDGFHIGRYLEEFQRVLDRDLKQDV